MASSLILSNAPVHQLDSRLNTKCANSTKKVKVRSTSSISWLIIAASRPMKPHQIAGRLAQCRGYGGTVPSANARSSWSAKMAGWPALTTMLSAFARTVGRCSVRALIPTATIATDPNSAIAQVFFRCVVAPARKRVESIRHLPRPFRHRRSAADTRAKNNRRDPGRGMGAGGSTGLA